MIPIEAVRVVLVVPCDSCQQDMPADHACPSPAVEALIRAVQNDPRYGSQPDIDIP